MEQLTIEQVKDLAKEKLGRDISDAEANSVLAGEDISDSDLAGVVGGIARPIKPIIRPKPGYGGNSHINPVNGSIEPESDTDENLL